MELQHALAVIDAEYDAKAQTALEAMQRGEVSFRQWNTDHTARCEQYWSAVSVARALDAKRLAEATP